MGGRFVARIARVAVVVSVPVALLPVSGGVVAHVTCTATIGVPNLSITSTATYSVKGTLTSACGATQANWDMDYGVQNYDSWFFNGTTTEYAYYYPGMDPLGQYTAVGTYATDASSNPVPQANRTFYIKLGSATSVAGYRSGNYVWLHAYVKRYNTSLNYGSGGWQPSSNRYVTFYHYYSSAWHYATYAYTGSNGWTKWIWIYAPTHRYFRVSVSAQSTIWGANSSWLYL